MEILRYSDLDVRGLEAHVERAAALLREGDFRAADARKIAGSPFYRARLNDKDRLLFRFVKHGGNSHLVLLELIRNHAYEKSRFLNGAWGMSINWSRFRMPRKFRQRISCR